MALSALDICVHSDGNVQYVLCVQRSMKATNKEMQMLMLYKFTLHFDCLINCCGSHIYFVSSFIFY